MVIAVQAGLAIDYNFCFIKANFQRPVYQTDTVVLF